MFDCVSRRVGTLFVFSCVLLLGTQFGCPPQPPQPPPPPPPEDIDAFAGIDPAAKFQPSPGMSWHVLAVALNLSDLAPAQTTSGSDKLFEELSAETQAALTAALDAAASGPPQSIFLPPSDPSGAVASGIGFALQTSPTDWHAFGFPALKITEDPSAPIVVSLDGPVISLSRETLDKLRLAFEPIIAGAASDGFEPLDPAFADELSKLADDLESFLDDIRSDDSSDGIISARQELSLTIPGSEESEVPGQQVVADVSFDLVRTDSGDRWVGGLGADVTVTDLTTDEVLEAYEFELAYGQQQVENLPVIRLEPGDGNDEGASRLAGEWLASLTIGDLFGVESPLLPPTPQPDEGMKTGSAGDDGSTMSERMRQATGVLLSTITGVGIRDPRAQVSLPEGDTLYVRLRFSESGQWEDLSFAVATSEQIPEAEQFDSLDSLLRDLQAELDTDLPPIELRTSMSDSGYVRLDVVATDLVEALLASAAPESGLDGSDSAAIGELPDISALVIGGLLSDDVIDGVAIILLLAQDIRFERQ